MTSHRSVGLLITGLLALAFGVAGCGAGAIDETELEAAVASQLAAETGQDEPNIDCPGDLDAEVGAETECELSVDGDDAVYPVAVEVTAVEDGTASYKVEVGDEPISGGDSGDSGDSADATRPADGEAPADDPASPDDTDTDTDTDTPTEESDPPVEGTE